MQTNTRHRLRRPLRAALLATSIAAAGLVSVTAVPVWATVPMQGYADLVEKVSPSVVFIEVTAKAPERQAVNGFPFGPSSPFDEFMRRFGIPVPPQGQPGQPEGNHESPVMRGVGSGFIISADGEIVTNNHVVDGATDIKVKMQDGKDYSAHVVGTDPLTDIALVKLDNASDLPVAQFGDSDHLRVGDAVVAVGNPFGLGGTVTSGIVSAVNRNINSGPYDSFIQTDAAINRGNSGGPLFNASGEVVGMNTAIFSPTGGSVGIGFSVPAATIVKVVSQLRDHGSVERGWLGVQIQPVTADLAEALGLSSPDGALVAAVQPDSPAAAAKLQSGDVITAVNGSKVTSARDLSSRIAGIEAGKDARLSILRDGTQQSVDVTIGKLSPEKPMLASAPDQAPQESAAKLGISVQPLSPLLAQQLGLDQGTSGVVVAEVDPDSPNADRLQAGDVITQAAGKPVSNLQSLDKALAGVTDKSAVLLKITRGGATLYVGASLAKS